MKQFILFFSLCSISLLPSSNDVGQQLYIQMIQASGKTPQQHRDALFADSTSKANNENEIASTIAQKVQDLIKVRPRLIRKKNRITVSKNNISTPKEFDITSIPDFWKRNCDEDEYARFQDPLAYKNHIEAILPNNQKSQIIYLCYDLAFECHTARQFSYEYPCVVHYTSIAPTKEDIKITILRKWQKNYANLETLSEIKNSADRIHKQQESHQILLSKVKMAHDRLQENVCRCTTKCFHTKEDYERYLLLKTNSFNSSESNY